LASAIERIVHNSKKVKLVFISAFTGFKNSQRCSSFTE